MKKSIFTKNAPQPIGPYSQAIMANNMLYISGQIPMDPVSGSIIRNNIQAQTKQVMENIKAILIESGLEFSNIIKISIFLTDMQNFNDINEIYGSYFKDKPPAREVVEVSKLPKNVNIEISAIAVINS